MKKLAALTMAAIMCLSFGACSSNTENDTDTTTSAASKAGESSSKVPVSALEEKLKETGNWEFETEAKDSYYEFKGKGTNDIPSLTAEVKGKADSKWMIYSAELTYNGIVAENLSDATKLEEMMASFLNDYSKVPMNQIWSIQCVLDYIGICSLCSGDTNISVEDSIKNVANGTKYQANGWEVSVKISSSAKTCTVTAEYKG